MKNIYLTKEEIEKSYNEELRIAFLQYGLTKHSILKEKLISFLHSIRANDLHAIREFVESLKAIGKELFIFLDEWEAIPTEKEHAIALSAYNKALSDILEYLETIEK